ncbi:MAG: hypothetical protein AB8F94_17045 [Saprospiraceae bacterium]
MKKWTKGLFLLMSLFLIQSCVKDFQDIDNIEVENWQPEVAVALVNTTVSIQDFLNDFDSQGYLDIDDENFMTLVYESNVFSVSGEDIIDIPDITIPMLDTNMVLPYSSINTSFDIDFFTVKNGVLNYAFQSTYDEDMNVIIEVRNLTQNGAKLSYPTTAQYSGSSPTNVSGTIDLSGYVMDFVNDEIEVRYIATNAAGERKFLQNMVLQFQNFEYSIIQGYFDQYEFDLPSDTILINLFETAVSGSLKIEDPKINLKISNSFGIPIGMVAENLTAETMSEGTMDVYSVLDDGIAFNYPSLVEVGESKITNIGVNKDNSNLSEIISSNPTQLNYELGALTNPAADPSIRGFVLDNSRFDVDVKMELPVWLSASDFAVEEVSEFDASFFEDIESASFKLITENGLPIEAGVQVYFMDENNVVLDSLFNSGNMTLIPAAEVNTEGEVTAKSSSENIAEFTIDRIAKIKNATQISIKGMVSTAEMGTVAVKFYTDYGLTFKLGVVAKLDE